jgi:hypothetical protein
LTKPSISILSKKWPGGRAVYTGSGNGVREIDQLMVANYDMTHPDFSTLNQPEANLHKSIFGAFWVFCLSTMLLTNLSIKLKQQADGAPSYEAPMYR